MASPGVARGVKLPPGPGAGERAPAGARGLREAFGRFVTGVTIVTARPDGGAPAGFTANSFTSLSLDPPLLIVCPHRRAATLIAIRSAGRFGVQVLTAEQQPLAERFATRAAAKFERGDWLLDAGPPRLAGAAASFDCALETEFDGGDHVILVGRVLSWRRGPGAPLLVYAGGVYGRLAPPMATTSPANASTEPATDSPVQR